MWGAPRKFQQLNNLLIFYVYILLNKYLFSLKENNDFDTVFLKRVEGFHFTRKGMV